MAGSVTQERSSVACSFDFFCTSRECKAFAFLMMFTVLGKMGSEDFRAFTIEYFVHFLYDLSFIDVIYLSYFAYLSASSSETCIGGKR